MANASNNGLIDALAWILDSVEIIHAVIKWEVVVPLELPTSLASEDNVPYNAILKQIFENLKSIQDAVFRRCQGDTKQNNVQRVDGRTKDPKDSSREIPVELRWVNEALDSVLQKIWGGSTINTEVPGIKGIATKKPQTAKHLNKIRKRCNIIIVKYISLQPKGTTINRQTKNDQVVMLEEKVEQLQTEIKALKEEGSKLRSESDKRQMSNPSGATSKTDKQIDELQNKVRTLTEQRDKYAQEMNALKTRLASASSSISSNTRLVTDMSDLHNPKKLADKYTELFDNDWADAFQVLTFEHRMEDKAAIGCLFEVLQDCFKFCERTNRSHTSLLLEDLIYPFKGTAEIKDSELARLDDDTINLIKDAKRIAGTHAVAQIQVQFLKQMTKNKKNLYENNYIKKLTPYIDKCLELCWFMVLQYPTLHIDDDKYTRAGEEFDRDLFNFYKTTGSKLDYVIWPTLYLSHKGIVLAKGIAQPKQEAVALRISSRPSLR